MRTRIKICGLTREDDIDAAVAVGADAVGFVLYPPSPRAVSIHRAAELARRLPPFVAPVGLFVNASPDDIAAACRAMPTLVLQFHGDETPEDCAWPQRPFLRAARVTEGFALLDFAARFRQARGILLDAHVEGYGGGGKVFDWSLVPQAAGLARDLPPLVLSGGLSPANVGDGIAHVRPWAVDVSSGVERSGPGQKGIKDHAAMRRFCDAVRAADALIEASVQATGPGSRAPT
ncbi:MAG TPA: phosphoribosylanthranilate isomerase [Methylibium sp.]|uniref:phosphoribosylanthranilate isomerase n=1 Tax=Methylibium sp. TaxID=2067992 RepID=UPI002DBFEB51|nr:phosphoribosylanthranilate isomerase [Methylibium sp.]HEU4457841.1 phosphoribosylanthranilate isomerase [Methylibium sp.]